jgi:hypothetical protein
MTTETTQQAATETDATEAEVQTQPETAEPDATTVADDSEDEGTDSTDAEAPDSEDDGDDEGDLGDDDEDDEDGDDEDDEDSEEETAAILEDASAMEAIAEGDADLAEAEIAEDGEPEGDAEGEPAEDESDGSEDGESEDGGVPAEDKGPALLRILPLKGGGMSAAEMLEVAPVVFATLRVGLNGPDGSALGAFRLVPAALVPEGWELDSEHAVKHYVNGAHCGTWRITAVFTKAEDGSIAEEHVTAGPDPLGRGGKWARDLAVAGPVSRDARVRVNRLMDAFMVSEKALHAVQTAAAEARRAAAAEARAEKAAADKAAKAAATADPGTITGDITVEALAIQAAVNAWRKDAEDTPEMGALPGGSRDELKAFLAEAGYLEIGEDGIATFPFGDGDGDAEVTTGDEAGSGTPEGPATVVAEPPAETTAKPQPPRHGGRSKHRRGPGSGKLQAGASGMASRA